MPRHVFFVFSREKTHPPQSSHPKFQIKIFNKKYQKFINQQKLQYKNLTKNFANLRRSGLARGNGDILSNLHMFF